MSLKNQPTATGTNTCFDLAVADLWHQRREQSQTSIRISFSAPWSGINDAVFKSSEPMVKWWKVFLAEWQRRLGFVPHERNSASRFLEEFSQKVPHWNRCRRSQINVNLECDKCGRLISDLARLKTGQFWKGLAVVRSLAERRIKRPGSFHPSNAQKDQPNSASVVSD